MSKAIPLSLYLHFPWCIKKCPYCDFNAYQFSGEDSEEEYITRLCLDLEAEYSRLVEHHNSVPKLHSVFLGGGTPSLFSADAISQILDKTDQLFALDSDTEITLEANPGATDKDKFRGYIAAGVNRLSIGIQSLFDDSLQHLGRIHTANDAIEAFNTARHVGFTNINVDMMHGLPDQSLAQAMDDLGRALALASEHLSWYQLTIEPNTLFNKYPPRLPDQDLLWEIYESGMALLSEHGYARYEISAFSQPGYQCKHNLNYWQFGDYLGVGAGAHGKLTNLRTNHLSIERTNKTRAPADYLRQARSNCQTVGADSMVLEFMMNALRMKQGFSRSLFETRTGLSMDSINQFLQASVAKGLLTMTDDNQITPTDLGLRYVDEMLLLID